MKEKIVKQKKKKHIGLAVFIGSILLLILVFSIRYWFQKSPLERQLILSCHKAYHTYWKSPDEYVYEDLKEIWIRFDYKGDGRICDHMERMVNVYQEVFQFLRQDHDDAYSYHIAFYETGGGSYFVLTHINFSNGTYGIDTSWTTFVGTVTLAELAEYFPDAAELYLSDVQYNSIEELMGFKNLTKIVFLYTDCTEEDIEKIYEMFPDCDFEYTERPSNLPITPKG